MSLLEIRLPKYTCTLPITKKKVEYRPFTVKEEKILLLAQEDNTTERIVDAINQIIQNCTFNKYNVDTLNKVDAEYLFIQLRNKSMGEGLPIKAICKSCEHKTPMMLNLEEVKIDNQDFKPEPIKLFDGVWITMRLPNIHESINMVDMDSIEILATILDTVIEDDNVKEAADYTKQERIDFIESLTVLQLTELKNFFDSIPQLSLDVEYTCKCGTANNIHIEGIESFFV